jgi:hypothetical protein
MIEFEWDVPDRNNPHRVVLQLWSNSSWFAWKRLLIDGQVMYTRSWQGGVDAAFALPGSAMTSLSLRLINEPVPGSPNWRPVLYCDGRRIPELTADVPEPTIVPRPREFSIFVGVVALTMFVCLTSFGAFAKVIAWFTGESGYGPMGRWLIPFACTGVSLAGYWDMRRWGPILLSCLVVLQAVLLRLGWLDIPVQAILLQTAVIVFGFVFYRQMR